YGDVTALAEVSFALGPGERAALLGRNGAGKSTLVRLVTGLRRPAAGSIWVEDWDTRDRPPEQLARRVGSMFQYADQQLFARTVRDDVSFGPRALGFAAPEVTHDLALAAETLERALVLDRGRLACDEPLAGLLAAPPRLEPLGLAPPAVAALSRALGLPGAPVREADAARALARVAAGRRAPLD